MLSEMPVTRGREMAVDIWDRSGQERAQLETSTREPSSPGLGGITTGDGVVESWEKGWGDSCVYSAVPIQRCFSTWGDCAPPCAPPPQQRTLAMSRGVFGCHSLGEGMLFSSSRWRPGTLLNLLRRMEEFSGPQTVSRAEVEKRGYTGRD